MSEPFVFDQYGRLEIHKRHMEMNRPYPLRLGSDWYIVHRADDGVRINRWRAGEGEFANGLFPTAPRMSLHLGQQVAAKSHLPDDLRRWADEIEGQSS